MHGVSPDDFVTWDLFKWIIGGVCIFFGTLWTFMYGMIRGVYNKMETKVDKVDQVADHQSFDALLEARRQTLEQSIEDLNNKIDSHIDSDNAQFKAIDVKLEKIIDILLAHK